MLHFFHIPVTQSEPEIEPDGMTYYIGLKAAVLVALGVGEERHACGPIPLLSGRSSGDDHPTIMTPARRSDKQVNNANDFESPKACYNH